LRPKSNGQDLGRKWGKNGQGSWQQWSRFGAKPIEALGKNGQHLGKKIWGKIRQDLGQKQSRPKANGQDLGRKWGKNGQDLGQKRWRLRAKPVKVQGKTGAKKGRGLRQKWSRFGAKMTEAEGKHSRFGA